MIPPAPEPALPHLIDLEGRGVVVTGGAGGLGQAIGYRLAEAGAAVHLVDHDRDQLRLAVEGSANLPGTTRGICADVTNPGVVDEIASGFEREPEALRIWINNAGVGPRGDFVDITAGQWDEVQTVNLRAAFLGARAAARRMLADGAPGVIVNISSSTVARVSANAVHYRVSKAGLVAMVQSLAVELGPAGIRALAVAPTLIETPALQRLRDDGLGPGLDRWASRLPLGRAASPDEVARVVLFCVSDMASFMTGSVVAVDGGEMCR